MNVISFSLWGTDSRLHSGALVNVELARRYYPGWYCVFYLRDDVPRAVGAGLEMQGAIVHWKRQTKGDWEGLFWRFEPIYDINIKTTLSRDCDSRLNPREAAAVEEWLRTPRFFHSMRDHYEHNLGIMGGMFGCHYWGAFKAKLEAWTDFAAKGCDQVFLNQVIWPEVRDNTVAHDLYHQGLQMRNRDGNGMYEYRPLEQLGRHDIRPFPDHEPLDPALHGEHVGARVGV